LTQKIQIPSQTEAESKPAPNPDRTRVQNEIASYQKQITQGQSTVSALDAKIQELQTQIPKLEETVKLAPREPTPEPPPATKTNAAPEARQKTPKPPPSTKSEPPGPWYSRAWKWISSFWH
jgi:hypothetical protein